MNRIVTSSLLSVAGWVVALHAAPVLAQASNAPAPPAAQTAPGDIPTPAQPDAIPLRAPPRGALPEQWEVRGGSGRDVRNVVAPTLTPVLPNPAKATGAAVIVAPGGGFAFLSIDNEGYRVARYLADRGIAAFVLKYRTRPVARDRPAIASMAALMAAPSAATARFRDATPEALEDGQEAVRLLRWRAATWKIDPRRIGFVGFSAGAMTALSVALAPDVAARPDFIGAIYGPMDARPVPADAPPMFAALAADDPLFARGNFGLIDSWRAAKRPVSFHLYEKGSHGFGMTSSTASAKMWIEEMLAWMEDRGLMRSSASSVSLSTAATVLGDLLDNRAARGILAKHLPQLIGNDQIAAARGATLRQLQGYAPADFPEAALNKIDAELAQVK